MHASPDDPVLRENIHAPRIKNENRRKRPNSKRVALDPLRFQRASFRQFTLRSLPFTRLQSLAFNAVQPRDAMHRLNCPKEVFALKLP